MLDDYDVAIVGSGIAGLSAAIEAAETGARVLLAEAANIVGGSSRLSTGIMMGAGTRFQRTEGIHESPDDLFHDYLTANHWDVEIGAVRRLCDECGVAIEWLVDNGLEIRSPLLLSGGERVARGHSPVGDGAAIVKTLHGMARRRPNIDIALGRRVGRLLFEHGRVCGIAVGEDTVTAGAVVLATGGFARDPELMAEYYPDSLLAGDWAWYIGADGSRGDGLRMARTVGAAIVGKNRGHCGLNANFTHGTEASYLPGWLVLVNSEGERFFDEQSPYSVMYQIVLRNLRDGGRVYAILDDAVKRAAQPHTTAAFKRVAIPSHTHEDWIEPVIDEMVEQGKIAKADTVIALAAKLGLPRDSLVRTLNTYNDGVRGGVDHLYRKNPSVLREIVVPPFYAAEMRLSKVSITAAGPRIDADARVLRRGGSAIPGLFAAGEASGGVIGKFYLGSGNSVSNCLVFGRIAGRVAATAPRG